MLVQWNFKINGLIPKQAKLKRKVWLKKGELLLEQKGDDLVAYLLGEDKDGFNNQDKIVPYLWMTCLVSSNSPDLTQSGGSSISSKEELGTQPVFSSSLSISYPNEVISEIENHAHKFIVFIGKLHDKYIKVIEDNKFMKVALEYFYDAQKKFVYSDEGFISAMISMESMFNEGPSDIKYKLSHRASFLLGLSGVESIEAFEKLKALYNTRSKLVHGGGSLSYDPDRHLVSRYIRKAIIIFLILLDDEDRRDAGKKRRKENLLKEIDYAMLDIDSRMRLEKEIKKGLRNFELKIPRVFEGESENGKYRVKPW